MYNKMLSYLIKYFKYYQYKVAITKEISGYCECNLECLINDGFYYHINISRDVALVKKKNIKIILESNNRFDTILMGKNSGFFLDDVRSEIASTIKFIDEKYGVSNIYYTSKRGMVKKIDKNSIIDSIDISMRYLYIVLNKKGLK